MTTAFVFPGQGSQKLGMFADLHEKFDIIRETFEEASEIIGEDLFQILQSDETKLNQTAYTQAITFTASVALWRQVQANGVAKPAYMAGHSVGEYSALVCAESLSLTDAVRLVFKRGQLMQSAVKPGEGAMAAILALTDDQVISVCEASANGDVLSPVNFNCPGQVVIAGTAAAVDRACVAAKEAGARRAQLLPVSVPSHCALMKPAADELSEYLDSIDFKTPVIPVIHNVDVLSHSDAAEIRSVLKAQLYQPVRWVETIEYLASQGVAQFVECGLGKVLSAINKRICDGEFVPVNSVASLEEI